MNTCFTLFRHCAGFDPEAVSVGCQNRFSANPFVRQAIADYFALLGRCPCSVYPTSRPYH